MKNIKRGCIISSGGAWGAYGAGTLARLNKDYDIVVGISTGALMSPLVALKDWDTLKNAYTSVTQKDIFDIKWYKPKPFNCEGNPNLIAILYALIFRKKSISTSKNLKKTIDKFLNEKIFNELKNLGKEIIVGTQNLREEPSLIHYFNSKDWDTNDFKDWMWCSANAPFFSTLLNKDWYNPNNPQQIYSGQWTDGGLTELIAIDQAYKKGCDEIDIIIHKPIHINNYEISKINNLIENVERCINAMRYDIEFEHLNSKIKYYNNLGIKINVWWLPRKLSNNSLIFNKKQMLEWWEEGYQTAYEKERHIIYE